MTVRTQTPGDMYERITQLENLVIRLSVAFMIMERGTPLKADVRNELFKETEALVNEYAERTGKPIPHLSGNSLGIAYDLNALGDVARSK